MIISRVNDSNECNLLKTRNSQFPTTVEPFNGAATGTGGEIVTVWSGGVVHGPLCRNCMLHDSLPSLKDENGKTDIERDWEDILPCT